jgi:hypothetical protein
MRAGFTLVETLVALLLFQIGMLAVAARDIAIARRTAQARDVARNRIETLRATACGIPTGSEGSATPAAGVVEHWRVSSDGGSREIVDSVVYQLPAGRSASVVIRGGALCNP